MVSAITVPIAVIIGVLALDRLSQSARYPGETLKGESPAQLNPMMIRASDPAAGLDSRVKAPSPLPPSNGSRPTPDQVPLAQGEREYLWQIEHHGLLLSRHGFSRLAQALRRNDQASFEALLADEFEGWFPDQPRETVLETPHVRVLRQQDSGHTSAPLDRSGFVARLFADRAKFSRSPQIKLALMALAPVDRKNLGGLWEGTCQLRMWGEAGPGRPAEVLCYLRYRLSRPTEAVLKGQGWLRSGVVTLRQVSEAPQFLFREVAAERGIATERLHDNWKKGATLETFSGGVYLCDFNRDGCLDLLLIDFSGNTLYEGKPDGTMRDATDRVGLPQSSRLEGAAVADLDNDGWEDLVLGASVYQNEQGKRFRNRGPIPGLNLGSGSSLIVADYDRDGKLDFFVTALGKMKAASWVGGEGKSVSGNSLWHNDGGWHFSNMTKSSGATGGDRSTFTAVWLDADEDGWPDLYVANEFGRGVLLVNRRDGTFREQMVEPEPGDFGTMGLACGDYDNDGHIDIYAGNMYSKAGNRVIGNLAPGSYPEPVLARLRALTLGSQVHRNRGGLKFEQVGRGLLVADVGWAYGPVMVDLNNDGWLDLYATCGFISQSRDDPDG
jgi:hypothetical protein